MKPPSRNVVVVIDSTSISYPFDEVIFTYLLWSIRLYMDGNMEKTNYPASNTSWMTSWFGRIK